MQYANLEQRMARSYLDLFPPFLPLAGAEVSIESQAQFYNFMKHVFQTIFDSPEQFFKTINADDAFPNRFNKASYGKPKLDLQMKKDLKEIEDLLMLLFAFGQNGRVDGETLVIAPAVQIKKRLREMLPLFSLHLDGQALSCSRFRNLFSAWHWLATRENASLTAFWRCLFDPAYPYMEEIYARLCGSRPAFEALAQYLRERGYRRVDLKRGPDSVDYIKQVANKQTAAGEVPLGFAQHGDPNHYGLTAEYRPYAAVPQFLTLRILEMKNLLLKFDRMPASLQDFTLKHVKKCDNCGYCTQTDKTGKRKPIYVEVIHGEDYKVCPLYPGFNFVFTQLDDALVANLVEFLGFMDRHLVGEG